MTTAHWIQFLAMAGLLVGLSPLLGRYMARVYGDGATAPGDRLFLPVERAIYRLGGVDPDREQRWTTYALSLVAFSIFSFLVLYALQRLQGVLPLNPNGMAGVDPALSANTAMSFTTNTNWQNYSGETTMSHLTQMAGLTVQNFVSAAAGMATLAAVIRGLARRRADTLGNFWVDLTRSTTRILLPLSIVVALILVSQGVIQNLDGYTTVTTLSGAQQAIPGGPVASQVAIKHLGTNGGGFFGANSAYPLASANPVTNFVEIWALLAIAFALPFTFGRMVGRRRQGWVLFGVMFVLWAGSVLGATFAETAGNPALTAVGADQTVTVANAGGGNLEGKEVRFGAASTGLFVASTTSTSTGAVNSSHDSLMPLGGGVAILNMAFGEIYPGGVGVGLIGLLVLAILAVFLGGLMVGRTPEFLGKKIEPGEMKLTTLYVLAMPTFVLVFTAISVLLPSAIEVAANAPGPHGLSEVLYSYVSTTNNNGSAMVGLGSNTYWYNTTEVITLWAGRLLLMIPALGIAGSLARKQPTPASAGSLPTDNLTFAGLLIGVAVTVAGLTFLPVLALGPIVEHLQLF